MREIREQSLIIFEDRPIVLPAFLAVASMGFAVDLAMRGEALFGGVKEAVGMLLGFLLCALGAVLFFRRDRFAFDIAGKRLSWQKWSPVGSSSGDIGFDEIIDVTLESISSAEGGGTHRVALRTPDGTLPLTESYSGHADAWRPVVARLREIVGLADGSSAGANMEALLAQGRRIDAIRQLRETEGLDLAEARAKAEAAGR